MIPNGSDASESSPILQSVAKITASNPSNAPEWLGAYLERTENSYHTTKRHPSVVAFALATQSANGINLYESYLNMKRFGDSRPFIYPDAGGEWDSDKLALE